MIFFINSHDIIYSVITLLHLRTSSRTNSLFCRLKNLLVRLEVLQLLKINELGKTQCRFLKEAHVWLEKKQI